MPKKKFFLNKGFTFVELIVTTLIILTLVGFGVASYNQFNENQTLRQAALTLKNNLRAIQTKAISIEKFCGPEFCGGENDECDGETGEKVLNGWEIKFYNGSYETYGVCEDIEFNKKTYNLLPQNKIIFSPLPQPNPLRFSPLTGNINSDTVICISGFNKKYKITISSQGEINDNGIVVTCP